MRRGCLTGLILLALILILAGAKLFSPFAPRGGPAGPAQDGGPCDEAPAGPSQDGGSSGEAPAEPDIRTATLAAVGDIMGHETQFVQARTVSADGTVTYDFSPSFDFIAPYLLDADLAVGNLETTFAGPERGYSGYPLFNTPVELAGNLKEAGFDLLATANNHSLDMGIDGLKATVENIRAAGLQNFGTYLAAEEQSAPLIVDLNGINVAFLAYTESTNGIPVPAGYEYSVNYIPNFHDITPILDEIERARRAGADIVAIYMHWGLEYHFTPAGYQRDLARRLAEAGADLILGSHPHVIQPLEWITVGEGGRAGRQVLVAYSMGNFVSNQFHWPPYIPTPDVKCGLIVRVELQKDMDSNEAVVSGAGYEITWVHREWRHRILPAAEVLAQDPERYNLEQADFTKLRDSYARMVEVVEKYNFSGGPD